MTCQKHGQQEVLLIEERKNSNIFPYSNSHLQKSGKLGFYSPLPFISQFSSHVRIQEFSSGGQDQSDKKKLSSSSYFTEVKWLISKKTIIVQGSRGGQTVSRGSNFFQGGPIVYSPKKPI